MYMVGDIRVNIARFIQECFEVLRPSLHQVMSLGWEGVVVLVK